MRVFFDDCFEAEKQYALYPISSLKSVGDEPLVMRHWMMSEKEYQDIEVTVHRKGGRLYTSSSLYELSHKLPKWYPFFKDVTFKTEFVNNDDNDIRAWLSTHPYFSVFIKDHIKSLTTSTGSVAHDVNQFIKVIEEMRYYGVEGHFCFREFVDIIPDTEHRHFMFNGSMISDSHDVSEEIMSLVQKFPAKFFSFDTVYDISGRQWLVEVGDGQVSSTKLSEDKTKELYQALSSY